MVLFHPFSEEPTVTSFWLGSLGSCGQKKQMDPFDEVQYRKGLSMDDKQLTVCTPTRGGTWWRIATSVTEGLYPW